MASAKNSAKSLKGAQQAPDSQVQMMAQLKPAVQDEPKLSQEQIL